MPFSAKGPYTATSTSPGPPPVASPSVSSLLASSPPSPHALGSAIHVRSARRAMIGAFLLCGMRGVLSLSRRAVHGFSHSFGCVEYARAWIAEQRLGELDDA